MQDKEEQEMVGSELLRMLEDVANREIPCQVAYRDIQKRLVAAHAEGKQEGEERVVASLAFVQNDDGWFPGQQSQNPVVDQVERIGSVLSSLDEDTRMVARQMLYDLANIVRVDGRNQEKECIRRVLASLGNLSVLAPKEADNDQG